MVRPEAVGSITCASEQPLRSAEWRRGQAESGRARLPIPESVLPTAIAGFPPEGLPTAELGHSRPK